MRYEDAYQYQNIMGPLVKLEADYDKQMKEAQTQEGVSVRWDMGLNKKRIAYFTFAQKDTDMRLVTGTISYCMLHTPTTCQVPCYTPWYGTTSHYMLHKNPATCQATSCCCATRATAGARRGSARARWSASPPPRRWASSCARRPTCPSTRTTASRSASRRTISRLHLAYISPTSPPAPAQVDLVWKAIAYERMQTALKTFAVDETSVSGYIYHRLLGHEVEHR